MQQRLSHTRRHLQELTRRIERLETGVWICHIPTGTGVRAYQRDLASKLRRQQRARELRLRQKLVEAGLLQILKRGKTAEMRLTKNGCIQMLKDRICFQQRRLSEGWSCVIVFDIPEDAKTLRASFRRFLKQAGFHPLQLSVWITDKDVVKDLSCLVKRLDIERWVQLFVGIKQ